MNAEQRVNLRFLVKLGKTATESLSLLRHVYGDSTMSRARVFEWHKRFTEGREETDDNSRPGRPVTSRTEENIEHVRCALLKDRRITVRMIAEELSISKDTVWAIITEDLQMRKVCAKMVPKILTEDQKGRRLYICEDVVERINNDPSLLSRVVTGDESWIFEYDPESKRQSLQWKSPSSPRPQKARMSKSKVKVMLITFFDIKGIIHFEFLECGTTVNQHVYKAILQRLREKIRRKRRDLWENGSWILHHDNAPAHAALSVREFLAEKSIAVLEHPPYSPDLAPCDFFLFPKLKSVLKGTHHGDVKTIEKATTKELKNIPQEAFAQCMQSWKKRMEKCIRFQGSYFEGL